MFSFYLNYFFKKIFLHVVETIFNSGSKLLPDFLYYFYKYNTENSVFFHFVKKMGINKSLKSIDDFILLAYNKL